MTKLKTLTSIAAAVFLATANLASAQQGGSFNGPSSARFPSSGPYMSVAGGWKPGGLTQAYTSWGNSRRQADSNARARCLPSGSRGCEVFARASYGECLYIAARGRNWVADSDWDTAARVCNGLGPCEEEIVRRCASN
ncbi:MAG: hypothetical protein EON60_08670 [Alphaproteobacteria bacterium]|nr:MAG: hypothetical protein EON60_08670 [Alphaproteobacteria bacterium]